MSPRSGEPRGRPRTPNFSLCCGGFVTAAEMLRYYCYSCTAGGLWYPYQRADWRLLFFIPLIKIIYERGGAAASRSTATEGALSVTVLYLLSSLDMYYYYIGE